MDFPIDSIKDLEKIAEEVKWQYFEKLVEFIFKENDYDTEHNKVVVFDKTKRQYDLIAKKLNKKFIVECKKHKYIPPGKLTKQVEKHEERAKMLDSNAQTLLVTYKQPAFNQINTTYIVSLMKLNWFLNNMHKI